MMSITLWISKILLFIFVLTAEIKGSDNPNPFIETDQVGNIHINTSNPNASIYVNGVNLLTKVEHNAVQQRSTSQFVTSLCRQNLPKKLGFHQNQIYGLDFSPDGTILAAGGRQDSIRLYTTTNWVNFKTLAPGSHSFMTLGVRFAPDGSYLATGGSNEIVTIWSTSTWEAMKTLPKHQNMIWTIDISADGQFLASADREVKVFKTSSWTSVFSHLHSNFVRCVRFTPDSQRLISASDDQTIRIFRTSTWTHLKTLQPQEMIGAVAISPNGAFLLAGGDSNMILYETSTWQPILSRQNHTGRIIGATFSPDAKLAVTTGQGKLVTVWNTQTWSVMHQFRDLPDRTIGAEFSPDGFTLVVASFDKILRGFSTVCLTAMSSSDIPN